MNLLPDRFRKSIVAGHRNKIILATALALVLVAGLALLALLPAVLVTAEERVTDDLSALESRSEQLRKDRLEAQETERLIEAFAPVATSSLTLSNGLRSALSLRPAGVRIEAISFNSEPATLVLSGVSEKRDALKTYRSALEGSGLFKRVSVPVSALVGGAAGLFSITLVL